MAFMTATSAADTGSDRPPVLGWNSKTGRLYLHDRTQDSDGDWATSKTEVTMQKPSFAVDFGRLETGWIFFSPQGPQFSMAF